MRDAGWQESQPGDREVRQQLRLVLKDSGLPPPDKIFDCAYADIREHYGCRLRRQTPPLR